MKKQQGFSRSVLSHVNAWAVPVLLFSLATAADAQSVSGFGTIKQGVDSFVALVRLLGGAAAIAALVFTGFKFAGRDMMGGVMGLVGVLLAILVGANAQSIVSTFYSTTG